MVVQIEQVATNGEHGRRNHWSAMEAERERRSGDTDFDEHLKDQVKKQKAGAEGLVGSVGGVAG